MRGCAFVGMMVLGMACGLPTPASAALIPIGVLSFDTFIPGPGGTNALFVLNLTGDPASGGFALPPDFPVVTPLTFQSPQLSWTGTPNGSFAFGDLGIGPGGVDPGADLQFPDTAPISGAAFAAVLSTTLFELQDGRRFQAISPAFFASLTNQAGLLAPGDLIVLSVDATELVAPVPEPGTWIMLAMGIGVCVVARRRSSASRPTIR